MSKILKGDRIINPSEIDLNTVFAPEESSPLFFTDAATTTVLPACTYNNGAGTLTGNVNGALIAQDGITLTALKTLLVKNQVAGLQNGIYEVTTVGDGSNPFVLTRISTYNETAEVYPSQINVLSGTENGTKYFLQTTVDPTIGTSSIVFTSIPAPSEPNYTLKFVDVHTETALPTTPVYANGTAHPITLPGYLATYTAGSNAVFPTLQGVTPFYGMKVLVKDQADATKNGDYILINTGSASTKWVLRRIGYDPRYLYQISWQVYKGTSKGAIFNQTTSNLTKANIGISGNIVFELVSPPIASPTFTGTVTTPILNISSLPSNDDALTNVLVRAANGTVKYRLASSLTSAVPVTNKIYIDSVYGSNLTGTIGDMTKPFADPEYVKTNVTTSGTLTVGTSNGSETVTAASTTGIVKGQYLTGAGIPAESVVVSFVTNTSITLSKKCTATASITATWWTMYEMVLNGHFTPSASIFKAGLNIAKESKYTMSFGAFNLFDKTSSSPVPYWVKAGRIYGTHASSKLYSSQSTADKEDVLFEPESYYSIGTGNQVDVRTYQSVRSFTMNCPNFDCRFGKIAYFEGQNEEGSDFGNLFWNGSKYGLLGGIQMKKGRLFSNGTLITPAAIDALSTDGATTEFYVNDNITGKINVITHTGGIFNGYITGTTHTFGGSIYGGTPIKVNGTLIGTTVNITTAQNIIFGGYVEANIVNTQTIGTTCIFENLKGNYTSSTESDTEIRGGAKEDVFGLGIVTLTGTAKLTINNAVRNNGGNYTFVLNLATGTKIINKGYLKARLAGFATGSVLDNFGEIIINTCLNERTVSGTFNDYGTTQITRYTIPETGPPSPCLVIDGTGFYNKRGGKLFCDHADSKSGLLRKTASGGKIAISGGAYLKVANGLAPLQILSNTGTAQDVQIFDAITNCAVGFRLTDTFSDTTYGTAYAPNDLVGGTKREDTTYIL